MFLRCNKRLKDGKEHLYWSVVENRRLHDGRIVQRHVLYLGELNGRQEASWRKTVDLFGQDEGAPRQVALFPEEHAPVEVDDDALPIVRVRLSQMSLRKPRQWGACWLGCELWRQLELDVFWREHLPASRKGTRWRHRDPMIEILDVMRVNEGTFEKLWADSIPFQAGGATPRAPSARSYIALKIFAIQNNPDRFMKDMGDIASLFKGAQGKITVDDLRATCERYGTPELLARMMVSLGL